MCTVISIIATWVIIVIVTMVTDMIACKIEIMKTIIIVFMITVQSVL